MTKEEFLTVSNVCKAFGTGDSRQEVLRGMDLQWEKENSVCFSDHPVRENQHS